MHAPEEVRVDEHPGSTEASSSRNNSKAQPPEEDEDSLDTMTTDVLEFLGVMEPEVQPPKDSKKDK